LGNVQGDSNNFVAIFKQNDASSWDNFIVGYGKWFDFRDGTVNFENIDLENGNYQMRLFYNDNITVAKKSSNFKVGNIQRGNITTNKAIYNGFIF